MLRYLLHWEFKLEFFTPTHTRVADEELDRKEYDKNNLITITTLNFGIAKHTVRTTRWRNETESLCTILYLISSFFFFAWFCQQTQSLLQKQKHNRNNKVETALMNENAGGQTCRQKQTRALSPHCKNANANCKFQLERNSLLCSALSKTPVSSSLPLALTLLLGAQCARGALCLCILCCNCVSRYKFQWALLCYALRSVVEGREGRGVTGGANTPRQKKKMRARILRARVCVCVCVLRGLFYFL